MSSSNVDTFYNCADLWHTELAILRSIMLSCGLTETFKWNQPCYTINGKNVLIVSSFKQYAALNFFKGALLNDTHKILCSPGENTKAGRQLRFSAVDEIVSQKDVIITYVTEAITIEKSGEKLDNPKDVPPDFPDELITAFAKKPELKTAFQALTLGRQRAYIIFFTGAKQSKTVLARIAKYEQRILGGKGLNDCICGLSKKMPACDGSHKWM